MQVLLLMCLLVCCWCAAGCFRFRINEELLAVEEDTALGRA